MKKYMLNHKTLIASFKYAFEGIFFTLKYNQNLRIHFTVAILVIIASIYFKVNAFEMGILGVMIVLVICTEMINTALESMTDLITQEWREKAKIAKDVSAGMMLLTAIGAVIIASIIFYPYITQSL